MQLADVDGETMVVHFRDDGHGWQPHAPVRFAIEDGRVVGITDYVHVAYMLRHAQVDAIDRGE